MMSVILLKVTYKPSMISAVMLSSVVTPVLSMTLDTECYL
jgi:hypothetical protein